MKPNPRVKIVGYRMAKRYKQNETAKQHFGAVIIDINKLAHAANLRQSVYCMNSWGLLPAKVVMHMQTASVYRALMRGEIYEYIKETKANKPTN